MPKIQSLCLIPENIRFMKRINNSESGIYTLEEKIKNKPHLREKYRCEARLLSGDKTDKNVTQRNTNKSRLLVTNTVGNNTRNVQNNTLNQPKNWILNKTKNIIVLDFHANEPYVKGQQRQMPKRIHHVLSKDSLTVEELNSPILKNYYALGFIEDITENEMKEVKRKVEEQKIIEENRIEKNKKNFTEDKKQNQHINRSTRRSFMPGGDISISEIDMGVDSDDDSIVGDSVINLEVDDRHSFSYSEDMEMQRLINSISSREGSPGDNEVNSVQDLSSMFTIGSSEDYSGF